MSPSSIFDKVSVNYEGHFNVKYGSPCSQDLGLCVCFLKLYTDLTTEAFWPLVCDVALLAEANLVPFGVIMVPILLVLHGSSADCKAHKEASLDFSLPGSWNVTWKCMPEHPPHFADGLWEAAKSMKFHLRLVTTNVKLRQLIQKEGLVVATSNGLPIRKCPGV